MTKEQVKQLFIQECYGNKENLRQALKSDALAVQEMWSTWTDVAHCYGDITARQWYTWLFPWRDQLPS
ncbi:MAG: hypothetical protein IKZ17_01365 [Bacteroidaceae bacterium]|nr:hypothetical protein [Bacteroidaceae bacterium]